MFRLSNFEPEDPFIYGDDDASNADVTEAISEKYGKELESNVTLGFREPDIVNILDEQSRQVVFKRELYEH